MADGEITLKLDPRTLKRLADQASAAGETVEAVAAGLLDAVTSDFDSDIALRRLAEFDRNGGATMTVEETFERFDRELADRRAKL
ncbi:MAG: hypothetical protein Q7T61_04265 [Caulobacter sp.]|nr:hypothetical protein [Caulobacter sp.]